MRLLLHAHQRLLCGPLHLWLIFITASTTTSPTAKSHLHCPPLPLAQVLQMRPPSPRRLAGLELLRRDAEARLLLQSQRLQFGSKLQAPCLR